MTILEQTPSATSNSHVHKSRWGWHSCDYQTFLELKEFHRLLLRDLCATKRHMRWNAKQPQNRVRKHTDAEGRLAPNVHTSIPEPLCRGTDADFYKWVLLEYRAARKPQANPDNVEPLDLPPKWRRELSALRAFYA